VPRQVRPAVGVGQPVCVGEAEEPGTEMSATLATTWKAMVSL
jgi:Flp pilus assembly protein CpaB